MSRLFVTKHEGIKILRLSKECKQGIYENNFDLIHNRFPFDFESYNPFNDEKFLTGLMEIIGEKIPTPVLPNVEMVVIEKVIQRWEPAEPFSLIAYPADRNAFVMSSVENAIQSWTDSQEKEGFCSYCNTFHEVFPGAKIDIIFCPLAGDQIVITKT